MKMTVWKKSLKNGVSKFLKEFFPLEKYNIVKSMFNQQLHYGARFAAKESFLKALGIGLGMGVKLSEIEVVNDKNGKPSLALCGEAKVQIEKRKITKIHLSLTHTKKYSTAIVLLEKK